MAAGGDKKDNFEEIIKKVNENPGYKVLTKEEYENLLAIASHKTSTPKPTQESPVVRPKVSLPQTTGVQQSKVTFADPSVSPVPRLQFYIDQAKQLDTSKQLDASKQLDTSKLFNTSYVAQPFNFPKLPFFSGSEEPQKGETSYEVWSFEVKCLQRQSLQNPIYLPEHMLLQSIRNSLKGVARAMLVSLGEQATVKDILHKLDGFYGNVSTSETLIQSFYNDYQKDTESIVTYGSRLEQTLSRAIRCGHADFAAKDAMLRSKFWTGLKSQELKNSTRHLYDSVKDFQVLLREIRKVEQEEVSSSRPPTKTKVAQQQSGQASSDETNSQLLKQMTELMSRMKTLEQKLESQQQSFQSSQASFTPSSYSHTDYNPRGRGRGYQRGSWHGNSGRGYNSNYNNRGKFQNRGNKQNFHNSGNQNQNNRGNSSSSGNRGGANGRGSDPGGQSGGKQHLNY